MKKKQFYTNLIETSSISLEIGDLNLSYEERVHLISLADANMHSTITGSILSKLSDEDKKIFLKNLSEDNHEKVWAHLREKIKGVEEKIKNSAEVLKKELLKDIKEAKSRK